jgi:tetratricopeptide (TPR) repeat protein
MAEQSENMTLAERQREQAAQCTAEALQRHAEGALPDAIAAMRHAVLLYAAADSAETESATASTDAAAYRRIRADVCQRCGDFLTESGQHPEAAMLYQEAADLYGQWGGAEAAQEAHACAQKILAAVEALRARPQERLYLLIAQHERQQRQLALTPSSEQAQAECAVRIAQVFQRRERPQEAVERFREALTLYARAPQTPEVQLARAECHHRIATLLYYDLNDLPAAAAHYRKAIPLYTAHEPPYYGVQSSRQMCARALAEIERRLGSANISSGE